MSHFDLCRYLVLPVDQYFQLPFEEIVACLRFDNRDTRLQRRQTDKFAPFRCFWNRFIENCHKHYAMSAYVNIDEQLIPFRGRYGFRQYMTKKPDKYGILAISINAD